jgi:steroid delta-isomerase-like uncharacterized protein
MNAQEMKDVVEQFVESFWNQGDLGAIDRYMTGDVKIHEPDVGGTAEGLRAFAKTFRSAFPDWRSTPEEMVAEGDTVVERWTGRGTHRGAIFGKEATGNVITVPGTVIYRFRDGKIAEFRGHFDQLSLFQQLGLIETMA